MQIAAPKSIIKGIHQEQLIKVKELLKKKYVLLRECYKYYAGIAPPSGVPAIGINLFNEVIQHTNLIDNKTLKLSDVDVEYVASNVSSNYKPKIKSLNPERHLCRFELMELLVRIALSKFKKYKIPLNPE